MAHAPTPVDRRRSRACCGAIVAVYALLLGVVFVRELLLARPRGNEAQAIGSLKALHRHQARFREEDLDRDGRADYATLAELSDLQLIDGVLGAGEKAGYRYALATSAAGAEPRWMATASPRTPPGSPLPRDEVAPSGFRWFVVTQDGEVRQSLDGPFALAADGALPATARPLSRPTSPLEVLLLLGPVVLLAAYLAGRRSGRAPEPPTPP